MPVWSRERKFQVAVALLAVGCMAPLAHSGTAVAGKPGPEGKVTICHRTASDTNPYTQITVDASAVDGKGGGDHYLSHTGPIWNPTLPQGTKWGDIIPPIPGAHDGLNWTRKGRLIWRRGCPAIDGGNVPTPSPNPVSPSATPTAPTATASPRPSTSPSPSSSATPSASSSPSAPPEPPEEPTTPIVVIPSQPDGGGIEPRNWTRLLQRVKSPGTLTIRVACTVNGVRQDQYCNSRQKKGVSVRVPCNDNIDVRVRVVARRDGMRKTVWTGRWKVNTTSLVACVARGTG